MKLTGKLFVNGLHLGHAELDLDSGTIETGPHVTARRHVTGVGVDFKSVRRGGSTRTASCICGWRGVQRATMEMAADDAVIHERDAHLL